MMKKSNMLARLAYIRKHLIWVPILLGLVVALFAPSNVSQIKLVGLFVAFMANLVPMIGRLSVPFELTQVVQLYYSLIWISLPLAYYSLDIGDKAKLIIRLKSNRTLFWSNITFFSVVWMGLLYMFSYESPDPFTQDRLSPCMLHSRSCMGTFGGLLIFSLAALPKLVLQTISCYSDIYPKGEEV